MSQKIVVDWEITPEQQEQIGKIVSGTGYQLVVETDPEQAGKEAEDAEVLFSKTMQVIRCAKEMKWLCTVSAGVNQFVKPGVLPEGCQLTGSSGAYGVTLSEHMIMQTLMLMRSYLPYSRIMETDHWTHNIPMRSIKGARITVLGTGDIGTNYAKRARAFDPEKIIGINRTGRKPSEDFDEIGKQEELDRYLPETDLLVMSLPETPETVGILSAKRIALLPPQALIVNVGRGSSIDEAALVEALNAGRIAGAALDVMEHEPLPLDDPLRSAKNVLLTPHIAGQMTLGYTKQRSVDLFCENLERYLHGQKLVRVVDRTVGY